MGAEREKMEGNREGEGERDRLKGTERSRWRR